MTFITRLLSSPRTKANGQIDPAYVEYEDDHNIRVPSEHSPAQFNINTLSIVQMNKEELIEFAQETYGLKLHRKMSAGNMVKEIYDSVNVDGYIPPNERVRKEATKSDVTRSVGRPKGSKNKAKQEPLIENI